MTSDDDILLLLLPAWKRYASIPAAAWFVSAVLQLGTLDVGCAASASSGTTTYRSSSSTARPTSPMTTRQPAHLPSVPPIAPKHNSQLRWSSNTFTHEDDFRSYYSDTPSAAPSPRHRIATPQSTLIDFPIDLP
ncbi:hypothetical protein D9611_011787 [Ephemerocybe angulata]|uniref:Uncharacterized protein n=1 Tax=Ephemerocybe angulata TaxID=980116 RepID=A0A8H5C5J2_9AGAR|nr:hypothetical protein D9611_011787 [Tulosesus angulatus]